LGYGLGLDLSWNKFNSSTLGMMFPLYHSAGIRPAGTPFRFRVKGGAGPSWINYERKIPLIYKGSPEQASLESSHWTGGPFYGAEVALYCMNFYYHVFPDSHTWTKPVTVMGVGFSVEVPGPREAKARRKAMREHWKKYCRDSGPREDGEEAEDEKGLQSAPVQPAVGKAAKP
jgi:hypothetical protein